MFKNFISNFSENSPFLAALVNSVGGKIVAYEKYFLMGSSAEPIIGPKLDIMCENGAHWSISPCV